MSATLKAMRALGDPTRLRIVSLIEQGELSVNELQEITRMGQSRISTHLGLLLDSLVVRSRKDGKRTFYALTEAPDDTLKELIALAARGARELPEHAADLLNLRRVLARREAREQVYFDQVAGRFGRSYGPGRSWQAFGQLLLRLMPALDIADLGSGEGLISELLARRARRVTAVDNSEKMVAYGTQKAKKAGLKNLKFKLGDLEHPPLEDAGVDVVILSQALHHAAEPARAVASAYRILRPGGQLLILDLSRHTFEQAHTLYGDRWLGFSAGELQHWLEAAGFQQVEVTVVAREDEPPHFETILAGGVK
jgi:ubiquinone/menaquinone biosynthesis C-methylase UbiE/DNA-binding transcriptional ArsR family regulator